MSKCPVGESCLGCQYAADCAHPALQAERLRGEVAEVTRALDDAKAPSGVSFACGVTLGSLPLSLGSRVEHLAMLASDRADLAKELTDSRGEVARLTRERDEALSGECAAAGKARAAEQERDSARAEAEKLQQRLCEEISERRQASVAQYESRAESTVLAMLDANESMDVGSLKLWCSDAEAAVARLLKSKAITRREDGCYELTYSARRLASARAALADVSAALDQANAPHEVPQGQGVALVLTPEGRVGTALASERASAMEEAAGIAEQFIRLCQHEVARELAGLILKAIRAAKERKT